MLKITCPFLFICNLLLLISCDNKISHDPVVKPEFSVSKETVYSEIKNLAKTEVVWMEGYSFLIDTLNTSLNVQLINPKELPANKDSIIATQKRVASRLKSFLKDGKQFKEYNIIFIRRDTVRRSSGTLTSEEALFDYTFKESDL